MKWSKYQENIFKFTAEGSGHGIIEAVAGSSKTTSLLESINYLPNDKTWLLAAFNKKIAEELKSKAPISYNGDVRTIHSLGLKAVFKRFPKVKIEQAKNRYLLNRLVGKDKSLWDLKEQISKATDLCKGYLIEGAEYIDSIMDKHDIDTCDIDRDSFIHYVQKTLEASKLDTSMVDFSDMIWWPFVFNLPVQKYHFVFCDEAQDLNNAQVQLVLKACKRGGRIFAYGDRSQAIYAFRGADSDAMGKIKSKLSATELPLSISYRCPKLVVKEAQQFVPHIESAEWAEEGYVENISRAQMLKLAKPGCFILSRVNAPLIGLALGFIRKGIPATIQGRDIGQNLLVLIKKSKKNSLSSFIDWLNKWEIKEVARLSKKRCDTEPVTDKAACLRALSDACHDLTEVKERIKSLFEDTDEDKKIVLSSVHRAKGLERDVVFMLLPTFRTFNQEEKNITYVAITRSKRELYFVS